MPFHGTPHKLCSRWHSWAFISVGCPFIKLQDGVIYGVAVQWLQYNGQVGSHMIGGLKLLQLYTEPGN